MSDILAHLHTSILDILLLYCKLQEFKSFRRYAAPQVTCLYHVLLLSLITEKRTDCLAQVFSELFLVSRFRRCSGKKCDSTRDRQYAHGDQLVVHMQNELLSTTDSGRS